MLNAPVEFDRSEVASLVPDHPNVWTDGSLVFDRVTGVSSGAGFLAHQSDDLWDNRRWGHVDVVRLEGDLPSCGGFFSVPGPLQSVQGAELWSVIFWCASNWARPLGVVRLGHYLSNPLGECFAAHKTARILSFFSGFCEVYAS